MGAPSPRCLTLPRAAVKPRQRVMVVTLGQRRLTQSARRHRPPPGSSSRPELGWGVGPRWGGIGSAWEGSGPGLGRVDRSALARR
jgi:hypothetical protein